ncbi:MAG: hypothetical protein ABIC18_04730 [Candidatus Omnitrophota bacterium]
MRKQIIAITAVLLVGLLASCVLANETETITVTATVAALNPKFDISIIASTSEDTYDWDNPQSPSAGMNFGTLESADPNDVNSALTASKHFLVLVGVYTNSGKEYVVDYTGAPLANTVDPNIELPGGAWTIAAGQHYGPDTVNPGGLTTAVRSGEDTYNVYRSNASGDSDLFRLYFGITGDADAAAGADLIGPTQAAGTYTGTIQLDVYAL